MANKYVFQALYQTLQKTKTNLSYASTFSKTIIAICSRGGGGGTPHMKGVRMLVVSLRGVNFGFRSHLGCSGQNAIIFSREGLVQGCTRKNIKIYILFVF